MKKTFNFKSLILFLTMAIFIVFGPASVFGKEVESDSKKEINSVENLSKENRSDDKEKSADPKKEEKKELKEEANINTESADNNSSKAAESKDNIETKETENKEESIDENNPTNSKNTKEENNDATPAEEPSVTDDNSSKKDDEKQPETQKETVDEKKTEEETTKTEDQNIENPENTEEKKAEDQVKVDDAKKDNGQTKNDGENKFDISLISDTHVLPESLQGDKDNKDFTEAKNSDRKLFVESIGLLDAAIKIIEDKGSQILVISGDLTKDGERLGHEYLAQRLKKWRDEKPGRQVVIVPGNHDINNLNAYDFSSGEKVKTDGTSPDDFIRIYGDLIYNNPSIVSKYKDSEIFKAYLAAVNEKYQRDENYKSYAHGYTSYVTRFDNKYEGRNGLTIIGLDTAIYSVDSTSDHKDGHQETDGSVTLEQMKWMVGEVRKAQAKNDIVAVVCHHAFLPHFKNQEKILSPYIVHEWNTKYQDDDEAINGKTPAEVLADLGVKFLFTGHLHAHDVAHTKTDKGNDFFDIQTGSTVTYPLPVRHISFINNFDKDEPGFKAEMSSDLIKTFEFKDIETGNIIKIADATKYAGKNQLTPELVSNLALSYINKYDLDNFNSKKLIFSILKEKGIDLPENGYGDSILTIVAGLLNGKKEIETGNSMVSKVTIEVKPIENTDLYGNGNKIGIDLETGFGKAPLMIRPERLEGAIDAILAQVDTKVVTRENVRGWVHRIIEKMMQTPVYENNGQVKTLQDLANDSYNAYLKGNENQDPYITEVVKKYSQDGNDITADILKFSKGTIDEVFTEITQKIAYKIPDEKLPEDLRKLPAEDRAKFVKYLIESEDPNNGAANFIIGLAPAITGKNLDDTLSNKMLVDLIYKNYQGEKPKKVEGSYIVNMLLGMGPVKDMLNSLAEKLGGDTINNASIAIVDAMTNEKVKGYNYYLPDDKGSFAFVFSSNIKDGAEYKEEQGKFALNSNLAEDYKIEKIDILVDGKVVKTLTTNDNISDAIKALAPKGNIQVNVTIRNSYGNTFLLTSKASYQKAHTDEPYNPSNPSNPNEPINPDIVDNKEKNNFEGTEREFELLSQEIKKNIILEAPQTVYEGENIIAKVKNAEANANYALYLDENKIADVATNSLGRASALVKIPENSDKSQYTLTLRDLNGNILAAKTIRLVKAQAA